MEASRTVTRWEGRSVVAPDQDLWSPGRPPLGKVQTGGAGSAPTTRRAADGRAGAWVARPGWWGCAVRGRVRARPAPPGHVETEEGSACTPAVAPDLAWNTNPRSSNPHPSTLPHHDAPRPRARAAPTPRLAGQAGTRGLHPRVVERAGNRGPTPRDPRQRDTLRLWSGAPGGWITLCGAAGRCVRPSPPWVRGAEYALVNPLGSGWRCMLTGCGRGPKTVHASPPTALGGHGCALRSGRSSRSPPFSGGIPPTPGGWAGIASLDPAPDDTPTTGDVHRTHRPSGLPCAD
ncbi:hypothetical protein SAMN05421803_1561, partial [Nocardiopsis flavescens]